MAYRLALVLFFSANEPYYWPEQTNVLNLLMEQFSDLNDCKPKTVESPLAIALDINPTGSVNSMEMDNQNTHSCITEKMQNWSFPEHREETAVLHFAVTVRESRYFLLPGSYVEQRQVKQRYWMLSPYVEIDNVGNESSGSEASDHFIEDQ